jgi:uncharacterized protein (TIGR02646 family)
MNKMSRKTFDKPECLVNKAQEWTNNFIRKRQTNPKYWNWHQYNYEKVDNILAKVLSELSNFHCSYCGIFPLKQSVGGRSIDHFKPKSQFHDLAFEWTNLFIACPDCQKIKGSDFPDVEPLKPDSSHYHFDYWFEIDWAINKNYIIPNKDRNQQEQEIAQETIKWLGLNDGDRPQARFDELEKFNGSNIQDIWKWSYPFFIERGKN